MDTCPIIFGDTESLNKCVSFSELHESIHALILRLRTCGCPKDYALLDESCVKCAKLHLNCSKPGSEVHSALPLPGFTRLEFGIKAEIKAFSAVEVHQSGDSHS